MVRGAGVERGRRPCEAIPPPAPETHRCRLTKRDPDHIFIRRPISVPADTRTGIIAYQQRLDQKSGIKSGKLPCAIPDRQQPFGKRLSYNRTSRLEVVSPAK
jgi:hypothetical protein